MFGQGLKEKGTNECNADVNRSSVTSCKDVDPRTTCYYILMFHGTMWRYSLPSWKVKTTHHDVTSFSAKWCINERQSMGYAFYQMGCSNQASNDSIHGKWTSLVTSVGSTCYLEPKFTICLSHEYHQVDHGGDFFFFWELSHPAADAAEVLPASISTAEMLRVSGAATYCNSFLFSQILIVEDSLFFGKLLHKSLGPAQ